MIKTDTRSRELIILDDSPEFDAPVDWFECDIIVRIPINLKLKDYSRIESCHFFTLEQFKPFWTGNENT